MKRHFLVPLLLFWSLAAFAAGTQYAMRVNGLACPYCAYGIEKKLKQIEGVEKIDVDLEKGVVTVNVREGVNLTERQMIQLFKDAGFTYHSRLYPKQLGGAVQVSVVQDLNGAALDNDYIVRAGVRFNF